VSAVPAGGTYSPQTLVLDLSGPLGGEGKAMWRGEEKGEGKKGKGRDRKRRSGLAPRRKFQRAPTLQFITKLVIDAKLSLKIKTTKLSLDSCCHASKFSSDRMRDYSRSYVCDMCWADKL